MAIVTFIVGKYQSSVALDASDEATLATLQRFISRRSTPLDSDAAPDEATQYALDQALAEWLRYTEQEAATVRLQELKAQAVTIEEQAVTDSRLVTVKAAEVSPVDAVVESKLGA